MTPRLTNKYECGEYDSNESEYKLWQKLGQLEDVFEEECIGYQTGYSPDTNEQTILIGFKKSMKLMKLLNELGVKCYDEE